jgi:hypothetical protein
MCLHGIHTANSQTADAEKVISTKVHEPHHSIQSSVQENKNNWKAYLLLQPCCDPQKLSLMLHMPVENE